MARSAAVLTDSGGIQEETTWLKIPCLTLRPNTERPVTIEKGTNVLVPYDIEKIMIAIEGIIKGKPNLGNDIEKWEGAAGQRIAYIIAANYKID